MTEKCIGMPSASRFLGTIIVIMVAMLAWPSLSQDIDKNYMGCFNENRNIEISGPAGRVLSSYCLTSDSSSAGACGPSAKMTPALCIAACKAQGYKYAGVQYGEWCFCGNQYDTAGSSDNCTMRCSGDSHMCGGVYANSVYTTSEPAPVVAAPTESPADASGDFTCPNSTSTAISITSLDSFGASYYVKNNCSRPMVAVIDTVPKFGRCERDYHFLSTHSLLVHSYHSTPPAVRYACASGKQCNTTALRKIYGDSCS